jgi:hypothetical protein
MSAWVVSKRHIDAMVTELLKDQYIHDLIDPDKVGALLWDENHKSVFHRYPTHKGKHSPPRYAYKPNPQPPVVVLKAVACYEYQTCERPDWPGSEAFRVAKQIESAAISRLPGYSEAPWGID